MVCLGLEPGGAGWKAQTNPLSYGGTPTLIIFCSDCQHHIDNCWILMYLGNELMS